VWGALIISENSIGWSTSLKCLYTNACVCNGTKPGGIKSMFAVVGL